MAMEVAPHNPAIAEYLDYALGNNGLLSFRPRPDDLDAPGGADQQESFCNSKDGVAFLIGGNGAGTSVAAAYKAARFMLMEQPPPRRNTPFWVMSNTFENTCNVCWGEKLHGMGFIPGCEIQEIVWHNKVRNQPKAVVLKSWPTDRGGHPDKNWVIEFKTFEQGRAALQGASLGGFWISETPPSVLCAETVRGLRDYKYRGARLIEFTPLDPWLSAEMEQAIEKAPPSWKVYKANTLKNLPNLPGGQDWIDSMLAFTPDELHATRLYGDFAVFEGMIYAGFSEAIHMVDEQFIEDRALRDNSLIHAMGTDWGWTSEHAHCTLWAYWDPADGSWTVYDEYWTVSQTKILRDHINETIDRCEQWNWPVIHGKRGHKEIELTMRPGYRVNHADSAAPGNIREFNLYGVPTVGYNKSENSVLEGIYYIKHLLTPQRETDQPLLKISSRCKHLISEMRSYRWKRGQPNMMALNPGLARPVPVPRFDHGPDALRYMIMGERKIEGWEPPRYAKEMHRHAERNAVQMHRHVNGARGTVQLARNGR
jgi:phage terminase large subunit-like protein